MALIGMARPMSTWSLAVLLFALIYNISFIAAPSVTTGRLALALLLIRFGSFTYTEWRRIIGVHQVTLVLFGLVVGYSVALYAITLSGDTTQISLLANYVAYVLIGAAGVAVAAGGNLQKLLSAVAIATFVQAILIIYSFLSPDYRKWLGDVLVESGNIPFTAALRAPGFSNSSGALLSLIQALGFYATLFRVRASEETENHWLWYVIAAACAASTIVTGRTGLQLILFFTIGFSLLEGPWAALRKLVIAAGFIVALGSIRPALETFLSQYNPTVSATLQWAFEFFTSGRSAGSLVDLTTQSIPPLGVDTFIGTGRVVHESGVGNASGNDNGYVQAYYSLGLPMAIVLYISVVGLYIQMWMRLDKHRAPMALLLIAMIMVEAKEPFVFKYAISLVTLSFLFLLHMVPQTQLIPPKPVSSAS